MLVLPSNRRPIVAERLEVEIVQRGRCWYGHRQRLGAVDPVGLGPEWLCIDVNPPLVSWTRRGIERKARRWIERGSKEIAQQRAAYVIAAAPPVEDES